MSEHAAQTAECSGSWDGTAQEDGGESLGHRRKALDMYLCVLFLIIFKFLLGVLYNKNKVLLKEDTPTLCK